MKLYQSVGPNPRVVLMYLAESGVRIDHHFLDIMKGENRQPPFSDKSPLGHTPLLELADGQTIAESLSICEYLDEVAGGARLIGDTPEERAQTRMYLRMIDQLVVVPMTAGFRGAEGLPLFQNRVLCLPDAAADMKRLAADGLEKIEQMMGDGPWVAGERFSLADILLFCFVEFGALVEQKIDEGRHKLAAWHARVAARPSAAASANPKYGMEG